MASLGEPLILPTSMGMLVFGMDWFPMMGGQSGRSCPKLARKHGATHIVPPAAALGAVGLVSLKRQGVPRNTRMYSAARNVAQLFASGSVVLLIELQQQGYWLVGIHEGAVVARTDRIYRLRDDAGDVIDSLRQAFPQLQVLDQGQDGRLPSLDAIIAASSSRSQLQPLRRWESVMPWPVQGFALVLVLVLLLPRVFPFFQNGQSTVPASVAPDPDQVWRQAVAASVHGRQVHGGKGLRALTDAFLALPTGLGGWALRHTTCKAEGAYWQCQAEYARQDARASNSSFLAAAWPAWTVEFSSLDHVSIRWQTPSHGVPVSRLNLPSTAQTERHLLSALQGMRPGFVQMQVGQPVPVTLVAPKDHQGRALPRPKEQAVYATRLVRIAGPLRSASLLLTNAQAMAWQSASLTLDQVAPSGLASSKLNLSLQGHIYEIDKAMDDRPGAAVCAQLGVGVCAGP